MKTISVFGSSAPQAGSADYVQAERVGQLLAERGYAVATGGYMGTMEAVSKGAASVNGHVIGVTAGQIELFRPIAPNPFIVEEISYPTLRERLLHLIMHNHGMIVLPGGIGTLAEVSMAWNSIQVGDISPRPLVLLGDLWHDTINTFMRPAYVREKDASLIQIAHTPEDAVTRVLTDV